MTSIFEPQTRYSAREYMIDIWLDYWNNYLTVGRYAECNGLTDSQASDLIGIARAVYNSRHPEE